MKIKNYLKAKIIEEDDCKEIKKIVKILEEKTDFFTAPASTKYHLAFEGGLATHTLGVIRNLKHEMESGNWKIELTSGVKCALLHDLCKTNYYIPQSDGTYKVNKTIKGHGDRSVRLAEGFGIELSDKEKAMIEFHMGPFAPMGTTNNIDEIIDLNEAKDRLNLIKDYQNKFSNAVGVWPEILVIYAADHSSSVMENSITKENIEKLAKEWENKKMSK